MSVLFVIFVVIFAIVFIVLGLQAIFWPRTAWYRGVGWQFRNAEPSEAAVRMTRFNGVIMLIFGLILGIVSLFLFRT